MPTAPAQTTAVVTRPPEPDQESFLVLTPDAIERFENYRTLAIKDIHDRKELAEVNSKRMELVRVRTTVDKTRKAMNEDARKQIAENDSKAKAVLQRIEPIESHLKGLLDAAETMLEAERIEAANKLYAERVAELESLGATLPEQMVREATAASWPQLLTLAIVQAEQRKIAEKLAAEQKAAAEKEAAEREAREQAERESRRKQQEAEDAARKADAAKLAAERAEFARQQAEAKAKADAEAERQRIANEARERQEAERLAAIQKKLDDDAALLAQQRADLAAQQKRIDDAKAAADAEAKRKADDELYASRVQRLAAIGAWGAHRADRTDGRRLIAYSDDEFEKLVADEEAAESQRQIDEATDAVRLADDKIRAEAMRPDVEKVSAWIDRFEAVLIDERPTVGAACEDMLIEMVRDVAGCLDAMRGRLK